MVKNLDLVNLDIEDQKIIVLTYKDQLRSFTKQQLLELLDMAQGVAVGAANKASGASLASIGNRASRLLAKALKGSFPPKDQKKLLQAIENFNGIIKERANSPAYHKLKQLIEFKEITSDLKEEISKFLNKYHQLSEISIKAKGELGKKNVQTNVKKTSKGRKAAK